MKRIPILLLSVILLSMSIYWWNLDNKLIFYVIRPLLNKNYDSQHRDVAL